MPVLPSVPSGCADVSPRGAASLGFPTSKVDSEKSSNGSKQQIRFVPIIPQELCCPAGASVHPATASAGDRLSVPTRSSEEMACGCQHTAPDRKPTVSPRRARGGYGGVSCCRLPRLGKVYHGEKREVPAQSSSLCHHLAPNLPPLAFAGRQSDRFWCSPECAQFLLPL